MNEHPIANRSLATWLLVLASLVTLCPSVGCRLCCDTEDLAYPAYGGAWQRTRRDEGRVGSLFDPAGARTSELASRDTPQTVDELYRSRQAGRKSSDSLNPDQSKDGDADSPSKDPGSKTEADDEADLKRRADQLKNLELEDINIIPGTPAPPRLN